MSDFTPGSRIAGRYEIGKELGRGGHSVVYRGRDADLGLEVALKLLVTPPASPEVARERLRREVLALRALSHPHIVPVYEYVTEGPWRFLVMPLVPGRDLEALVARQGPMTPERAAGLGREIASALGAAHRAGILHRDVKPRNILLDEHGASHLTDFGSARVLDQATLTETGGLVGTMAYLAPEVAAGRRADARADVYALGLTLYFALAGRLPPQPSPHFPPTPSEDGYRPRGENLSVPAWLDDVLARATVADPTDRFPTADSFMDALAGPEDGGRLPVEAWEEHCLVCGELDVEGLTVCRRCAAAADRSDRLVFLEPGGEERERVDRLLAWFGGSPGGGHREVARGLKPLARIPDRMTEAALDRLATRGLSARAVPVRDSWRQVPLVLWILAGLSLGLGVWAGSLLHPGLLLTSPAFATLLLVGAISAARQPLIDRRPTGPRLAVEAERRIQETAPALPHGAARDLFAGIVRLLRLVREAEPPATDAWEEDLVGAAARAALVLARVDEALATATPDPEGRPALERERDQLVQLLLDSQARLLRLFGAVDRGEALADLQRVLQALATLTESREDVERLLA